MLFRSEQELDAELRFHLERQVEANLAAGMTPEQAHYAARRTIGGMEQIKDECRDARAVAFIETLMQDVRYGFRMMRRSPTLPGVAVLSLSLGIGPTPPSSRSSTQFSSRCYRSKAPSNSW